MIPVAGVPGVRGLSLSADGTRLAFAGLALDSQIWSLPIARGWLRARPADAHHQRHQPPQFIAGASPDGKKIAYMSIRQGELPNVWVMDADGTQCDPVDIGRDRGSQAGVVRRQPACGVHVEARQGRRVVVGRHPRRAVRSWC